MATSYGTCIIDLSNWEAVNCKEYPKGGVSAAAILLNGYKLFLNDFTDPTEWQDAIDAGYVKIIGGCEKGIRMEHPAGSQVTGQNPSACGNETTVDGRDDLINWEDANVTAENDQFYATLGIVGGAGLVIYMCEEDNIRVITEQVSFEVTNPVIDFSNRIKQKYQGSAKWFTPVGELSSELTTAPDGIFSC